jgi:ElaB/YqjD/DUF883 family membrane-anchored ribosome-binding protein
MPEESTVIELVNRMAGIEARLKSSEDKSDRIESMLNELVRNQGTASQGRDDRTEKLIADRLEGIKDQQRDKLEGIKDQQREAKTKIESLEGNRKYNIVSVSAVCGTLFVVFTWFNNQAAEATRQLITSENTAQRSETQNRINEVSSKLQSEVNQNSNAISTIATAITGYPEFKAQVTQQNSTSIQDRADQKIQLAHLEAAVSDLAKEVRGISSWTDQKFTEVETQFNADGQVRNVQFSDQQRTNGMMWNSLHDLGAHMPEFPGAPFFQPNVSQHPSGDDHK